MTEETKTEPKTYTSEEIRAVEGHLDAAIDNLTAVMGCAPDGWEGKRVTTDAVPNMLVALTLFKLGSSIEADKLEEAEQAVRDVVSAANTSSH